jgi:hypothetical protein
MIRSAWIRNVGRFSRPRTVSRFRLASERAGRLGARLALPPDWIAMSSSGISIELTSTQLERVVRRTTDTDTVSNLLRGLAERGTTVDHFKDLAKSPRMSRSLLLGLLVLAGFPGDGTALAVTDVATRLEMSPSTTHRYLTTLLAVGLLEQDPRTRRYRIPLSG